MVQPRPQEPSSSYPGVDDGPLDLEQGTDPFGVILAIFVACVVGFVAVGAFIVSSLTEASDSGDIVVSAEASTADGAPTEAGGAEDLTTSTGSVPSGLAEVVQGELEAAPRDGSARRAASAEREARRAARQASDSSLLSVSLPGVPLLPTFIPTTPPGTQAPTGSVPPPTTTVPPPTTTVPPPTTEVPPPTTEVPPPTTEVPPPTTEVPVATTEVPVATTEVPSLTTAVVPSTTVVATTP